MQNLTHLLCVNQYNIFVVVIDLDFDLAEHTFQTPTLSNPDFTEAYNPNISLLLCLEPPQTVFCP